MLRYYFQLALRNIRRQKALTVLMVLGIGLGIGATMTMLTVQHVLSGDPLPGRSANIYRPQVDPRSIDGYSKGTRPPRQVTWMDGMNLLHARRADEQALMTGGVVALYPTGVNREPFRTSARYTSAGYFSMFGTPFRYGHAWNREADHAHARVVILSNELNDKLFDGRDSVGKTINL